MWGYDPGNVSSPSYDHQVSPYHHKAQKTNIFITELSPVYCCLVTAIFHSIIKISYRYIRILVLDLFQGKRTEDVSTRHRDKCCVGLAQNGGSSSYQDDQMGAHWEGGLGRRRWGAPPPHREGCESMGVRALHKNSQWPRYSLSVNSINVPLTVMF